MKSTMKSTRFLTTVIVFVVSAAARSLAMPISSRGYSIEPRNQMYEILHSLKSDSDLPISRDGQTTDGTTCLRVAPDLPPCNFDSQATWRSTSGEIFHGTPSGSTDYQSEEIPKFPLDSNPVNIFDDDTSERRDDDAISDRNDPRTNLENIDFYDNDLATTVVYYLEGCLPSRLPFNLPSCPTVELRRIRMNKLVPFKLFNVEDDLIFPDIDVKQIKFPRRLNNRTPPLYPNREESEAVETISSAVSAFRDAIGSSLRAKEDEGGTGDKSTQKFQSNKTRKRISPIIGIATTKYTRKLSGSGHPAIISSPAVNKRIIINDNNNKDRDNEGTEAIEDREKSGDKNRLNQ